MATIDLYGRPGCHLCDDARAQLLALQPEYGFRLNDIDIEADDDLHKRYLERIPVIVLDGEHLFDFFVDDAVLRDRLGTVGGG
ncbi:glutaredoxin family protein [Conexibacter woesei]|uniref:glutaredoxin family protein n=1 Tax=Conexibacter woesei TaxID=191495 RepID=UPI00040FF8E7|nr:glutaredoxin family protein [Conexibacter woesei]